MVTATISFSGRGHLRFLDPKKRSSSVANGETGAGLHDDTNLAGGTGTRGDSRDSDVAILFCPEAMLKKIVMYRVAVSRLM
jgi:hypothetical protein